MFSMLRDAQQLENVETQLVGISNLLTSLVMPVDRLDFYKKSKAIDAE